MPNLHTDENVQPLVEAFERLVTHVNAITVYWRHGKRLAEPRRFDDLCNYQIEAEQALARFAAQRAVSVEWPEVDAFALSMKQKLTENAHKGGWRPGPDDDIMWLRSRYIERLREESGELHLEVLKNDRSRDPQKVLREAADVANFAMFLADISGAIDTALINGKEES